MSTDSLLKLFRNLARLGHGDIPSPKTATLFSSEDEHFFQYTSGRWIYNEREQMRIQYVSFDVAALKRVAAAVVKANHCIQMVKTAKDNLSKHFLLTFDNGAKLVAKIPCPHVTPRHLSTLSEVATMDYAKNILGLPVPRVLSWNAKADGSEVGAEYILMEHLQGMELYKMDKYGSRMAHFAERVADLECKFTRYRFSQIGSIYYKEDVSPELQQRPLYAEGVEGDGSDRFRIGPCVNSDIWRGKRSLLDVDRGPWPDTLSYIKAIIEIEKQWLANFAVPRNPRDIFYRPNHDEEPDTHIRLLGNILAIIPSILPPDEFCAPMLWHTNLQAPNIFVSSEGPPDIASIVGWQGISVGPLFLQATFAQCIEYCGDDRITIVPLKYILPLLPPDFETYSEEEQAYLKREEKLARLHKYYEVCIMQRHPLFTAQMTYPHMDRIVRFIVRASQTWYNGTHTVRQALLDFEKDWNDFAPGKPLPISWDANEVARHCKAYPKLAEYEWRVRVIAKRLQLELDGWVPNEQYDDVTRRNKYNIKHWRSRS
ncbi:hypothetical protein L210DRAFT_2969073 [Boletus edulis BED1]|uniref:Altered inheritance of mitochondria protein 9, mitochondrial n=1 Tax=Boletus edulis BED1 TaxID=1328754 RepID=A0AAD4C3I8_BOLED|nr:hypothetical protein L210DRAFT_2969073 [Boletus edulis BED1]